MNTGKESMTGGRILRLKKYLKNEKYLQAQSDFKYVLMRGTGSDLGDDAQYHLNALMEDVETVIEENSNLQLLSGQFVRISITDQSDPPIT